MPHVAGSLAWVFDNLFSKSEGHVYVGRAAKDSSTTSPFVLFDKVSSVQRGWTLITLVKTGCLSLGEFRLVRSAVTRVCIPWHGSKLPTSSLTEVALFGRPDT